jgi:hypothetical protein
MIDTRYPVNFDPAFRLFEFVSDGPKGAVTKVVRYSETNLKDVFNLGFGDRDRKTGNINDLNITNNGDSQKVLATVAATLYVFTDNYPEATVVATGSTLARTRLYRMGITTNLEAIEQDFNIFGLSNVIWEPFRKGIKYDAFLVRRKP